MRRQRDVIQNVIDRWGRGRVCYDDIDIEWESTKYKGKCLCGGFAQLFNVSL